MKSSKNLLVSVTAALFSVAASAQGVGTSATFKGPVGVQIYSLRNQLKQDGAKALDVLKDLNVKYVEIGIESHYGLTQEQMKQALDERGLIPIAAHAGQGFLLNKTDEAIAAARFFGLKYLGVAWASHKKPLDESRPEDRRRTRSVSGSRRRASSSLPTRRL